jgi:AraC-like DNA-binding protein
MKHRSDGQIQYSAVAGMAGLETLSAERLQIHFDRHFHDSYSFGVVLEGVERCSLGRALNIYERGTVPMFNPGEVHDGGPATAGGWSYRMVYIDPALVPDERVFPEPARRDALAQRHVLQFFDAIDCGSPLGIEEALALALDTLLERGARPAAGSPALQRVRERIDAECSEALRLRDLCALAGVSATRLCRSFEAAYGLTPHRYQQSRRIAKARRMLIRGTPLAEIAAGCGYADQTHLNRWFLRVHGTTPGRYRRAFFS